MILQAGKQVDSLCEAPDHLLLVDRDKSEINYMRNNVIKE